MLDVMQRVYRELKTRILSLEYLPSQSLSIRDLAKDLEVSPTPVREAVIRLEAEDLVRRFSNGSLQVAAVDLQDVKDVLEARLFLDTIVAKLATQRASAKDLEELREALTNLRDESDPALRSQLHALCHERIDSATNNRLLSRMLEMLRNQQLRVRAGVERTSSEEAAIEREVETDFQAILEGLEDRDEDRVCEALRRHTMNFIGRLQDSMVQDLISVAGQRDR